MTRQEAVQILARLSIAYPEHKLPDPAIEMWANDLTRIGYGTALQAVEHWRTTETWHPKVNQFLEVCDAMARRMSLGRPSVEHEAWIVKAGDTGPEDDDNPPPREVSIAAIRATLAHAQGPLARPLKGKIIDAPSEEL